METKKISFSFSKINKKPSLLTTKGSPKHENKVELIKCLEGQEIKLIEEKPEQQPLIIPLNDSQKTSGALASLKKRRAVLLGEEEPADIPLEPPTSAYNESTENIEKRAARELLADVKNAESSDPANNLVLPVVKPEELALEGAKEPTLDDYESVPIQDFGKAVLRGMGWTEPIPKSNKNIDPTLDDQPLIRPKGMGLGADRALTKKPLLVAPDANEVLEIKRNAYVRILGGKYKDLYGQIEGFDDHAGRVIVKMAIGGTREAFNEFLCQPVSRKEYAQYGKCINTNKYQEYKKKENEYGQVILAKDEKDSYSKKEINIKKERQHSVKDEHAKFNSDYRTNRDKMLSKNDKKEIKIENDRRYKELRSDSEEKTCAGKNCSKDEVREGRKDTNKEDARDRRRNYDGRDKEAQVNDYTNCRQRKHGGHELKYDYPRSETLKRADDDYKITREYDRSCNKNRDTDRERDRKTIADRNDRPQYKKIKSDDSSDSETDMYISKHRKYKKDNLKKKTKKSKKSKSQHKTYSSDDESSSVSKLSLSDGQKEKQKKHKKSKKSKKIKKQRERSRSRERR